MSKMDALRAMREAAHDQAVARAAKRSTPAADTEPPAARRTSAPKAPKTPKAPAPPSPSSTEGLCGHRSMNGRTCTREQGHAAKSHRYT
ncbi:MAG: hypothetical protein ACXWDL_04265 [Nocardioides sp.]